MIIKRDSYYPPAGQNRTLHIWLPDTYYETQERYPVMYFFDGHNLFNDSDATYGTSWGFRDFLTYWDKPIIMVGMECSHEGDDRLTEYCPYEKHMFGKTIHGIGDATFQWIVNDIKPMIDREYRTYSFREATGIGGSSMGGIMAVYGGLAYNHVFSKAACVSPAVFWNLSSFRKTMESSHIDPDTKFYLSWGEYEGGTPPHSGDPKWDTREARSQRKFARELQERGAQAFVCYQPEGGHNEASWREQVPHIMEYLWKNNPYEF